MGISVSDSSGSSFSDNVLKIELSGPTHEHFDVVDLPGIFRSKLQILALIHKTARTHVRNWHARFLPTSPEPSPGQTTKEDIVLMRTMINNYIRNPRSIILYVSAARTNTEQ